MFGMSRAAIANIETGRVNPKQKLLLEVCHQFGVSEIWLRTGYGEMRAALSHREEAAALLERFLAQDPNTLVHRLTEELIAYEHPEELESALETILDFITATFPNVLTRATPKPAPDDLAPK